jgi:hypothetical protein
VDWLRVNSELHLAGDSLSHCFLTGQPLAINVMPSKVVIQVQQGNMLAQR